MMFSSLHDKTATLEERGKIHLDANDKHSHYRNRKLYNAENLHHNKQHNIFDYKYAERDQNIAKA